MRLECIHGKLTYIIDTLHCIDNRYKGSCYCLHKLAYELADLGNIVYIFNEPMYQHSNIKVIPSYSDNFFNDIFIKNYRWDPFEFDIFTTVSVYTQITWGNPFGTYCNTRWLLHDCEDEKFNSFGKNDLVCNLGNFKTPKEINQQKLTIFDYQLDNFYDKKLETRKGFGHILHKKTPDWANSFLQKFESVEIPHHNGLNNIDYLNDEFNKYEYILTFDDKTYYTSIANLCGAKSIILNQDQNLSPTEYRLQNPINIFGVSYGLNDIEWSRKTLHLVRDHLSELQKIDYKTVVNFNNYWYDKLSKT